MSDGAPAGAAPRDVASGAVAPPVPAASRAPGLALITGRLGFRLSSLFAVALLPLGLISLVQAGEWLQAAREQATAALMGDTLRAAAGEARLINEAQGAAAALAQAVPPVLDDEAACDAIMSGVAAVLPRYSVVGYVPANGQMTCAADGASFDYSGLPLLDQILADPRPQLQVQARGPVSEASIILVTHPVRLGGSVDGYVALALPHAALTPPRPAAPPGAATALPPAGNAPPDGAEPNILTFNAEGTVLTASQGLEGARDHLPLGTDLAGLAGSEARSFTGTVAAGQERFYAVVPLVEGELFALGSMPARQAVSVGPVAVVAPFFVAALMWAGSLLVAWFAAERLVTRYIRRLSRAIRAFAQGSRLVGDLDMTRAPAEIREAGDAFVRMTDAILHDEAELEDAVHQKEVLLREVHHRVKNNLQLIASIMNLQMRRARSPETRALMMGLQERVMSLATVHKELYQTSGLADVRADELLGDIIRQILRMASGPGRRFQVETDLAPLRLTPDQAVPLSLLLTEGLTNAVKYAGPEPAMDALRLRVAFAPTGPGRAELLIVNSARSEPADTDGSAPDGTGLGGQLITAFAAQLDGTARREMSDGAHALRVEFALAPLEGGEERRAASGPPRAA